MSAVHTIVAAFVLADADTPVEGQVVLPDGSVFVDKNRDGRGEQADSDLLSLSPLTKLGHFRIGSSLTFPWRDCILGSRVGRAVCTSLFTTLVSYLLFSVFLAGRLTPHCSTSPTIAIPHLLSFFPLFPVLGGAHFDGWPRAAMR
jgi:hypothetical protein